MFYTISNDKIVLKVNSFGAEITSLLFNGKERIWQNDNGTWDGHAFVLFPVCGHFRYILDGKDYDMPPHGFAYTSEFTLKEEGKDFLRFSLSANEKTKKYYPYDFIYDVVYTIKDDTLYISHEVKNNSDKELYFACGGHESYNFLGKLEDYRVDFEKEENPVWQKEYAKIYIKPHKKRLDFVDGKILYMPQKYLNGKRTLILGDIKSSKISFKTKDGEPIAETGFEGFSNLLFWRPKRAKMICIEPWTNLPDRKCDVKTEASSKKGLIKVEKGNTKTLNRYIKYYDIK